MAERDTIYVQGARQHNLKNISLEIPRNQLVVFTGVSGSGKSSLAFDTIFAEGQRRYVESLSAYARQFLGQLDKPDVDHIDGLSPAISIDQKSTSHNPRSTVGTVTEIYDYLRLLFGRAGKPYCPHCGRPIEPQTVEQIVDQTMALPEGTRFQLLAPVVRGKKGTHAKLLSGLSAEGFVRVRVDGEVKDLSSEEIKLNKTQSHSIEIVIDRLVRKAIGRFPGNGLAARGRHGPLGIDAPQRRRRGSPAQGGRTVRAIWNRRSPCKSARAAFLGELCLCGPRFRHG
jgi:excinuclease ABC subunit A